MNNMNIIDDIWVPLVESDVLILGETHYGDLDGNDGIGNPVDYSTRGVVNDYLSRKETGETKSFDRYFDKIANGFGYNNERVKEFYKKVYFANFAQRLCGTGDKFDQTVLDEEENVKRLFRLVNKFDISWIVCFSVRVFELLPESHMYKAEKIGAIGNRRDLMRYFRYTKEELRKYELKNDISVIVFRDPSSEGGYNPENIRNGLLKFGILDYI